LLFLWNQSFAIKSMEKIQIPVNKDKLAKGNPKTRYPTAPYLLLVFGEIGRDFSAFGRDFPTQMDRRNFLTTLALLVPGASFLAKLKPTPPRPPRPPPVPCPEPHAAEARNEA
jgi:hypothetical protein